MPIVEKFEDYEARIVPRKDSWALEVINSGANYSYIFKEDGIMRLLSDIARRETEEKKIKQLTRMVVRNFPTNTKGDLN